MNRKKALVSLVIVAMLLCSPLVLPVRATSSDWSKPRPSIGTIYDEKIGNSKTDGIASVGMGVHIYQYIEGVSDEDDILRLRISASANTRMGIQYYLLENDYIYDWCEVSEPTGITGDNDGTWLYPDFYFLYYGVEYYRVWVCSNGFIALNKTSTNANPQSIPSTNEPNPVIAVFWRDLHFGAGSSITYGRDIEFNHEYYFVVSWNNVLDDSGTPQTFQVLIQHRQPYGSDYHNKIFFQYKSVTQSYQTTVGTEDQVGNKGTAYDYNDLHNQACLKFDYIILGYRLEQLWIKLTKSDGYAAIQMLDTRTAGYNVKLKDYTNPWWADEFEFAIKTTATLLLWKARIAWKCMLIVADFAGVLANDLSPLKPEYTKSALEGEDEAWAYGDCIVENRNCRPFDSTLATTVEWLFIDANNRDHDLTVTAEAWYRDLTNDSIYRINTSSTLNMYIARQLSISSTSGGTTNPTPGTYTYGYGTPVTVTASAYSGHRFATWNLDGVNVGNDNPITVTMDSDHTLKAHFEWVNIPPNTPSTPSGPTSGYPSTSYTYSTSTTDPDGDYVRYQFYWGDAYTTTTGWYLSGSTASKSHSWGSSGTYYVKVRAQDYYGAWSGWSSSRVVSISSGGGGGGGCPILYVWDGADYVCEGLLDIHNPEGIDVIYGRTLVTTPQSVNGAYLMRLTEHPQTHSYIDQVKLYATLENGTTIELLLIHACHSEDGNVLPQLLHSDEWKADTLGADHNNGVSQSIDLKFAALSPNLEIVGFVFQIEGNNIIIKDP